MGDVRERWVTPTLRLLLRCRQKTKILFVVFQPLAYMAVTPVIARRTRAPEHEQTEAGVEEGMLVVVEPLETRNRFREK